MGNINKLRYYVYKILPLVYDDSLSYYEVVSKVSSKLNEVIDTTNSLPSVISEEIKNQLEGGGDIYTSVFSGIINAIATNEGNAKFTATTKAGGEVVWINDKLYKVIVPMEAGTNYIEGTNIELISIDDELNRIQNFICNNNEHYNTRATATHNIGEYIVYKDELYKCTKDINVNDILDEKTNGNITAVTTMNEVMNINNTITALDARISKANTDIASTNLRVNTIVSSTGNDNTEIVDGRTGNVTFNHETFATIGNAIRQETNYASNWNKNMPAIPTIKQNNYIDVRTVITNSYVDHSGNFVSDNPLFDRTPYIDISGTEKLTGNLTKLSAFYDESYQYISSVETFDITDGISVPSNAKYVVCSLFHTDVISVPNEIALFKTAKDYIVDSNYDYQLLKLYNWHLRTPYAIDGNTISFGFNLVLFNPTFAKTIQVVDTTYKKENELKFTVNPEQLVVIDFDLNKDFGLTIIDRNKISVVPFNQVYGKLILAYGTEEGIKIAINARTERVGTYPIFTYTTINKFTVNINNAILPTGTSDTMLDTPVMNECNCAYIMPYNYSDNGKPAKLLMVCHGAGKGLFQSTDQYSWNKTDSYINMLNLFAANGYFCFDCSGYENSITGFNFWGAERGVQAWIKAYDYITSHFNVEKKVNIYGFSMGGLTALNIINSNGFDNVKCVALGSPVINLEYICEHDVNALNAVRLAYRFEGDYNSNYTIGCDPFKNIFSVNDKEYYSKKLPPIRVWYGSTEIGGVVESNSSQRFINSVKNSNGIASRRIVDGRGHEICYGEDANVTSEIVNFLNRYNY